MRMLRKNTERAPEALKKEIDFLADLNRKEIKIVR